MRASFIGLAACAAVLGGLLDARAEDLDREHRATSIEVAAGTSPWGGGGMSVAVVRDLRPWFSATGNAEWGQRPFSTGGTFPDIDRRLAYVGGGARLRLFPRTRVANFLTMGVGAGRLSVSDSSGPAEWHLVPWTGIGLEARVGDRIHVGTEFRIAWLRNDGGLIGEGGMPLRVNVRVPVGR